MAASLVGQSLIFALATAPQVNAVDPGAPTPKEQALIERACPAPKTAAAFDAHERCLAARLLSLRADFGRDLGRLSGAARNKLDATCSPLQASRGREAYVDCLSVQLASLSAARARATLPAPAGAPLPDPAVDHSPAASSVPVPAEFSLLAVQPVAAIAAAVTGLTALVFFGVRAGAPGRCAASAAFACQGRVISACHAGTKRRKRFAARRANAPKCSGPTRRRSAATASMKRNSARRNGAGRKRIDFGGSTKARRQEEEARRREEDARTQAEELQRTRAAAECDVADSTFDPYRALGLEPGAGADDVRAAYEQARLKYDPDQVAHLGDDAQAHYAAKSRAAERAYTMLAGAADETSGVPVL